MQRAPPGFRPSPEMAKESKPKAPSRCGLWHHAMMRHVRREGVWHGAPPSAALFVSLLHVVLIYLTICLPLPASRKHKLLKFGGWYLLVHGCAQNRVWYVVDTQ